MPKKVLIITGSPRHFSNSSTMADWVASGARSAGAEVKTVNAVKLETKLIGCSGCRICVNSPEYRCVIPDEVSDLVASIPEYDLLVLATPLYFFNYSAQLKLVIDRFQSLLKVSSGAYISPLKNLRFALVVSAGGSEEDSGLEVLKLTMKYMSDLLGCPEAKIFFRGNMNHDSSAIWENRELSDAAVAFGASLVAD